MRERRGGERKEKKERGKRGREGKRKEGRRRVEGEKREGALLRTTTGRVHCAHYVQLE